MALPPHTVGHGGQVACVRQRAKACPCADGLPQAVAEMDAQAFRMVAEGAADWITEDVPTLLRRRARSFEQLATDDAGVSPELDTTLVLNRAARTALFCRPARLPPETRHLRAAPDRLGRAPMRPTNRWPSSFGAPARSASRVAVRARGADG